MSSIGLRTIALMLSIILWGTLLGGVAYSHLVFSPVYLSGLPDSTVLVNGPYGLNDGAFWVTIHPLLILSLLVTLSLNWGLQSRRRLILISFIVYVVVLIISVLYFVPELMAFKESLQSGVPRADWLARGRKWLILSCVRGSICYVAFVPLLIALTKSGDVRERNDYVAERRSS
jgi:hypothetical protein